MTSTNLISFNRTPDPGPIPAQSIGSLPSLSQFAPPVNAPLSALSAPSTQPSLEQRVKQIGDKLSAELEKCFQGLENRVSRAESLANNTNRHLSDLRQYVDEELLIRQEEMETLVLKLQKQLTEINAFAQIVNTNYQKLAGKYFALKYNFEQIQTENARQRREYRDINDSAKQMEEKINTIITDNSEKDRVHQLLLRDLNREITALREQNQQFCQFMETYSKRLSTK